MRAPHLRSFDDDGTPLLLARPCPGTCEADPLELRTPDGDGKDRTDLGAPGSSLDGEQGASAGEWGAAPPSYMHADDVDAAIAGLNIGGSAEALTHRSVNSGEALGGEAGGAGGSSRGRRPGVGVVQRSLVSRVSHAFRSKSRTASR